MKYYPSNQWLLAILMCVVHFVAFNQFSRSFHTTELSTGTISNLAYTYQNDLYCISMKDYDPNFLKFTMIKLDKNGETLEYHEITSPNSINQPSFNGYTIIQDTLLISLQYNESGIGKHKFIKINLSNYTITNEFSNPYTFSLCYSKCVSKGDSMVVYLSPTLGGIYRYSFSISQLNNYSIELVNATESIYSANSSLKIIDLILNGSEEYFVFKNYIYKRAPNGAYLNQNLPIPVTAHGFTLLKNGNNEIIVFTANKYQKFSSALTLMISGPINLIPFSNFQFGEAFFDGINYHYYRSLGDEISELILDQNFQIVQSNNIACQSEIYGIHHNGSYHYLYGSKIEYCDKILGLTSEMLQTPTSDFIVKNNTSLMLPFKEYCQNLSNGNQTASLGHLNNLFGTSNHYKGYSHNQNNIDRTLIFYAKNIQISESSQGYTSYAEFHKDSLLPGPFTPFGLNSFKNIDKYNRGYYVDKEMINTHLQEITSGNPNYIIPFGIREWPAHGDISIGQAANLAPFFDSNLNGIYEPLLGDYPSIYGDKCLLYIYHQAENVLFSNNMEIYQYNYVFDCDTSEALSNTIFMNTKNVNRYSEHLSNYHIGTLVDFDIGYASDDYMGTNVKLGMIYGYNGDDFDEGSIVNGFQDTLPAAGMMILKGAKLANDEVPNDIGVGLNQSTNGYGFGDDITDNEYYGLTSSMINIYNTPANSGFMDTIIHLTQIMEGIYYDGTPMMDGPVQIHHSMYNDSDPEFYSSGGIPHSNNLSEITFNNPSGDKRGLASSGGNSFLNMGNSTEYITAYIAAIDSSALGDNLISVAKLFEYGTTIKSMFNAGESGCNGNFDFYTSPHTVGINKLVLSGIQVYPNPFKESIRINGIENTAQLTVLNLNGLEIMTKQIINNEEINLSILSNAMYLLKIETSNGVFIKRIVKN
jgi:hypothetical protein